VSRIGPYVFARSRRGEESLLGSTGSLAALCNYTNQPTVKPHGLPALRCLLFAVGAENLSDRVHVRYITRLTSVLPTCSGKVLQVLLLGIKRICVVDAAKGKFQFAILCWCHTSMKFALGFATELTPPLPLL
jgi:hypothetical protein